VHSEPLGETKVTDPGSEGLTFEHSLTRALNWLWDGMRSLPYSDTQLSNAIGNCVALHQQGFNAAISEEEATLIAAKVFRAEVIHLEFGSADSSFSQGYSHLPELLDAVREDIHGRLAPAHREEFSANLKFLLQVLSAPDRTFDFTKLTSTFAQYLIPTQVLSRSGQAVFFSPARLASFGLP
jgi:hypothetical protein